LRAHRDKAAARQYFEKSITQNGERETVTIDKGANLAALEAINAGRETPIKRRTRPMLGFKNFRCARIVLGGIEVAHMIAKGQMKDNSVRQTPAEHFFSLAA
jgi:transposase-like protein